MTVRPRIEELPPELGRFGVLYRQHATATSSTLSIETFTVGEEEKGVVVNAAYLEQHVPFVRDRLKWAGIRLAHLLNATLRLGPGGMYMEYPPRHRERTKNADGVLGSRRAAGTEPGS